MSHSRELRPRPACINYKEPKESDIGAKNVVVDSRLSKVKPKTKKPKLENGLFPIEVVEEDLTRYRVHYVGYSSIHDEWKDKDDILDICDSECLEEDPEPPATECVARFSLYHELGTRIKSALNSSRKDSPVVRIDIPFDRIEYDGGLIRFAIKKRCIRGIQRYSIAKYQDLNALFGTNWHYKGINVNGDFCYAILNTIEFYLYQRRRMKEYIPTAEFRAKEVHRDPGDMLIFCFVKGDGTPDQFGKDKSIFVN